MRLVSDIILDCVELFLDTCPDLEEDAYLRFSDRQVGEDPTVRMMETTVGTETWLIVAKRVGGQQQ